MESINKDLFIDIDAVIASKSKRLAKFTPKFVVNWVKRIVHQDELNEILKFSNGAIDVEFADKVLLWLNAKSNVKFINRESLRSDGNNGKFGRTNKTLCVAIRFFGFRDYPRRGYDE